MELARIWRPQRRPDGPWRNNEDLSWWTGAEYAETLEAGKTWSLSYKTVLALGVGSIIGFIGLLRVGEHLLDYDARRKVFQCFACSKPSKDSSQALLPSCGASFLPTKSTLKLNTLRCWGVGAMTRMRLC
jgi:hypothetical protein